MKNSSSILVAIVASIFLLTSCSLDSDCTSNKLGTIQLSSRANNFLVLEDEAEVTFLNQEGKVITFENTVIENLGGNIQIEKTGEGYDIINGSYDCYDYYATFQKSNFLRNNQEGISLRVHVSQETDNPTQKNEKVTFTLYNGEEGQVNGHYFYQSEMFVDGAGGFNGMMEKLDELDLNGEIFTDVLSAESEHGIIYIKENEGVVGFELEGNIWVKQ